MFEGVSEEDGLRPELISGKQNGFTKKTRKMARKRLLTFERTFRESLEP